MKLKVGTRGSALALAQTNFVCDLLKKKYPNLEVEICIVKTKGDKILDKSLDKIGDKGLFVKEIEQKLLDKEIDFAVHSLKDMPSEIDGRLKLSMTPLRASDNDILIVNPKHRIKKDDILDWLKNSDELKIGTGSKRRFYQLRLINKSLIQHNIRGNIQTRINKMISEDIDAIVLAKAGIERLKITDLNFIDLDRGLMVPAVGQGALAVEIRSDDAKLESMIDGISDVYSTYQTVCEREYLLTIGAGCHSPVGAISYIEENRFYIHGLYGDEDGNNIIKKDMYIEVCDDFLVYNKKIEDSLRQMGQKLANYMLEDINNKVYGR